MLTREAAGANSTLEANALPTLPKEQMEPTYSIYNKTALVLWKSK